MQEEEMIDDAVHPHLFSLIIPVYKNGGMIDMLIAGRRNNGFPVAYLGRKPTIPVAELERWLAEQAEKERK